MFPKAQVSYLGFNYALFNNVNSKTEQISKDEDGGTHTVNKENN